MRSNSSSLNPHCFSCVGVLLSPSKRFSQSLKCISLNPIFRRSSPSGAALKLPVPGVRRYGSRRRIREIRSMDEGFSFDDWEDNAGVIEQVSSSEGEESDGEVMLNTLHDTELPTARNRFLPTNNALTVTTHRLAMLRRGRRKNRDNLLLSEREDQVEQKGKLELEMFNPGLHASYGECGYSYRAFRQLEG